MNPAGPAQSDGSLNAPSRARPPILRCRARCRRRRTRTALAMIFKLAEAAEKIWRRLDGHNHRRSDAPLSCEYTACAEQDRHWMPHQLSKPHSYVLNMLFHALTLTSLARRSSESNENYHRTLCLARRSVLCCLDHRLGDHAHGGHPCMLELHRKFVGEELL